MMAPPSTTWLNPPDSAKHRYITTSQAVNQRCPLPWCGMPLQTCNDRLSVNCRRQHKPEQRLYNFIDGFVSYTKNGTTDCLLAVFSHHRTAAGDDELQAQNIALQFADWHKALAAVFEECGCKPKRANQDAQQLLSTLYGALLTAKMFDEQKLFLQAAKRCKKDITNRFA